MSNEDPVRAVGNFLGGLLVIATAIAFWLLPIAILAWFIAFFLKSCK